MTKLNFKDEILNMTEKEIFELSRHNCDFFYDLFYGGYIVPSWYLDEDSTNKVNDAMNTIMSFHRMLDGKGLIED